MQLPLWKSILKRDDNPITEISHFLRETAIFEGMSRRTLREVARLIHKRKYYAGETIFYQGQAGTGVYLILQGKVEIFSEREGVTLKLAELEKGAFFGELALFQDFPRSSMKFNDVPRSSHLLILEELHLFFGLQKLGYVVFNQFQVPSGHHSNKLFNICPHCFSFELSFECLKNINEKVLQ